ncbi:MAG: gliding motility-associated ABC transporter substrate-binding protein GldG, partial [Runella slithyformis]
DADGLITARNKQITLRPLDKIKLKEERTQWQILNLLGPLVWVGLIGVGWQWRRKRRYGQ